MIALRRTVNNNRLLTLVLLAYAGLAVVMPDKAARSLENSVYYVKEMLLIMPVILLLTALTTAWVPRKTIEDNFGRDSGLRGSVFSFLLGSFSAGPIYAAFPVCKMLLKKGASVSNIVIVLSTWAVIKVPMLINETRFLGPRFMIVRWVLTTAAIFVMGSVISRVVKKSDIPAGDGQALEGDALHVNREFCIGCGLCARLAPDMFEIVDGKAKVIGRPANQDEAGAVGEAIERCASRAIEYGVRPGV